MTRVAQVKLIARIARDLSIAVDDGLIDWMAAMTALLSTPASSAFRDAALDNFTAHNQLKEPR